MTLPHGAPPLAALAALVLLTGCGAGPVATPAPSVPAPTPTATVAPGPSAAPSATARPAATPTRTPAVGRFTPIPAPPSATASNRVPADLGELPEGYALPREGEPATEEATAWEPAPWYASCLDRAILLPTLDTLEAARVRQRVIPEGADGEGILVFGSDEDAAAFVDELRAGYTACLDAGGVDEGFRSRLATGPAEGIGDEAFTVRTWTEFTEDGTTWVEAPGGSYDLLVRSGPRVALVYTGGEYVGDPATAVDSAALTSTVEQILA